MVLIDQLTDHYILKNRTSWSGAVFLRLARMGFITELDRKEVR